MIALDTNVLLRFYLEPEDKEDKKQRPMAGRMMANPALYVARTVMLEFEWVLRGAYKLPREEIAGILTHLTALKNVFIEDADIVDFAVSNYAHGLDFSDALHLAASARCETFATFDTRLKKRATRLSLTPPCVVPA